MRALIALLMMFMAGSAMAAENIWPKLSVGEVRVVNDIEKVPALVFGVAGAQHKTQFTFFKAPKGHDFVIVDPCCGEAGRASSLFERDGEVLKSVGLVMGDPRLGFSMQNQAAHIGVDDGAVALRARIDLGDCEAGMWTYYYQFDSADRLTLLSVIDTSCTHLGVRELFHARDVDLGHWWMK